MIFLVRYRRYIVNTNLDNHHTYRGKGLTKTYSINNYCICNIIALCHEITYKTLHIKYEPYIQHTIEPSNRDLLGWPYNYDCYHHINVNDYTNYEYQLDIRPRIKLPYELDNSRIYTLTYTVDFIYNDCGHSCRGCSTPCKRALNCTTFCHVIRLITNKKMIKIINLIGNPKHNKNNWVIKEYVSKYISKGDNTTDWPTVVYYNGVKQFNCIS